MPAAAEGLVFPFRYISHNSLCVGGHYKMAVQHTRLSQHGRIGIPVARYPIKSSLEVDVTKTVPPNSNGIGVLAPSLAHLGLPHDSACLGR